jgi:protein dithiol oxidoreductase (disulfide-forming)
MPYRLLGLLLLCTATIGHAHAQALNPFVAGRDYQLIEPAQPTTSGDRIEVIEAFAYTCPACASLQPRVNAWKARLPADVQFSYMPVAWGGAAEQFARGFYAAESLGVPDTAHDAMFNALHVQRRQFRGEDDIAAFYAEHSDVSKEDFLATMKSFAINTRINRNKQLLQRYGIDATPIMVVNGKYRVKPGEGGHDRMMQIVDHLIEVERRAKAG